MPKLPTIGLAGFALIAFLSFDSVKNKRTQNRKLSKPLETSKHYGQEQGLALPIGFWQSHSC